MTPFLGWLLIFVAFACVAAGLVLLAVASYLMYLFNRHKCCLDALLKLANAGLEPLQLPVAAWKTLAGGGIKRLDYSGYWFGQPVQASFGAARDTCSSRPFSFTIKSGDEVSLDFSLYVIHDRGELRLFAENLAEIFRLLIETSVHGKMEVLSAALSEQERLTHYLQHDLRNLAQWVEWLAADFSLAGNDADLLGIAQRLRTGAPHAAVRAKRILQATCNARSAMAHEKETLALAEIIRQAAEHAGIGVDIVQDALVLHNRVLVERALDNLFSNVAPMLKSQPENRISVVISKADGKALVKMNMPRLADALQLAPEKLFEPFASIRPGGLGLGLYQAHKSLLEGGGALAAEVFERYICFSLSLPLV